MLKEALTRAGYEVTEALDGKEGISLYLKEPIDLVITDIVMPNKEGIETIIELRQSFPEVKIIAMSGGGRIIPEDYLYMAKGLGAKRTFAKPFDLEKLLESIHELLQEGPDS